jgi:hypothetical protein
MTSTRLPGFAFIAQRDKREKECEEKYEQNAAHAQAVLNRLRNFIKDFGSLPVSESMHKAVHEEVARLIVLLQKISALLHQHRRNAAKSRELKALVDDVDVALDALAQVEPTCGLSRNLARTSVELARNLRIAIERTINRYQYPHLRMGIAVNRFNDVYRSESTPLKVLYGLIVALLVNLTLAVGMTIVLAILQTIAETSEQAQDIERKELQARAIQAQLNELGGNSIKSDQTQVQALRQALGVAEAEARLARVGQPRMFRDVRYFKYVQQVIFVILAGTLGSIISILIRIEDFQDKKYRDRATPFLIGGFKPIIGASFAIFFFTLIRSELVQIPGVNAGIVLPDEPLTTEQIQALTQIPVSNESREACFIFAVAFLVGFSERLATDAISKMEDAMSGGSDDDETTQVIRRTATETDVHQHVKEESISKTESPGDTTGSNA